MNYFLIAFTLSLALLPQDEPNIYNTWRKLSESTGDRGETITGYVQDVKQPADAKYRQLRLKFSFTPDYDTAPIKIRHYLEEFDCAHGLFRRVSVTYTNGETKKADDPSWNEPLPGKVAQAALEYACRDRAAQDESNNYNTWQKLDAISKWLFDWHVRDARVPDGAKYKRLHIRMNCSKSGTDTGCKEFAEIDYFVTDYSCSVMTKRDAGYVNRKGQFIASNSREWKAVEPNSIDEALRLHACRDLSLAQPR